MKTVALGELVTVRGGGTPKKSVASYFGGGIPWITPKDVKRPMLNTSEITLTEDGVRNSPAKLLPAGSVLVVVRSGVLKHTLPVARTTVPVTVNQDMKALIPDAALSSTYLAHLLKARAPEILGWVRATTADNFPIQKLMELHIQLPAVDEQRRIAVILDQADALRAKRRQVLAHLDALTQSIFHDMFRATEARVSLGEVIAQGPTNGLYRPASDYGSGTPILRIDGFDKGVIHSNEWKRVRIDPADIARYSLSSGDIIINRVNALSHLGKSALVGSLTEPSIFESNMMRLRLDEDRILPKFVIAWLQTSSAKQQILSKAKKAINQASIDQTDLRLLILPLPPRPEQEEFDRILRQVVQRMTVANRSLAALNELFESLQSRAFRGEL